MNDDPLDVRKLAIELAAIAQNGLAYSRDHFDIERFQRLAVLAEQLLVRDDLGSYRPAPALTAGYATPKVDVRAGVFDEDGRVLLVQEVADGRWSLPGGWCDVLETPRAAIEREVREEAGMTVSAVHLAAVIDREVWAHAPAYDHHVYKLFFVCTPETTLDPTFTSSETLAAEWFEVDELPELSIQRVLPEQIHLLHEHWRKPGPAYVD
ncbi:MAG TPA: NUDIX hydrolase N-terminal domain-containing protein [Beutenbergiaceae bacterium]|nr:NUDIX hydrolase N-terminal domain-containing protein [Beutenbergiaceae bacterium]